MASSKIKTPPLETAIIRTNMVGKTVNTIYSFDLPTGWTSDNTIISSITYKAFNVVYPECQLATESAIRTDVFININDPTKLKVKPVGASSINGDLVVVLTKIA